MEKVSEKKSSLFKITEYILEIENAIADKREFKKNATKNKRHTKQNK